MSKKQVIERYIFNVSPRMVTLSAILTLVSGGASTALAIPAVSDAVEVSNAVGAMSTQALLAAVTLGSLALTFYCVKTMFGKITEVSVSLAQIADSMRDMECVRDKVK